MCRIWLGRRALLSHMGCRHFVELDSGCRGQPRAVFDGVHASLRRVADAIRANGMGGDWHVGAPRLVDPVLSRTPTDHA